MAQCWRSWSAITERQPIESVGLGRAGLGLADKIGLDRRESRLVIRLGTERANFLQKFTPPTG
jgi:hypothetical protein